MKRKPWSKRQRAILRREYPRRKTSAVARLTGHSVAAVYNQAFTMGLRKSAKYLASVSACRLRRGDNVGAAFRFKPGLVPWNKGVHWIAGGDSARTRFKKGSKPHTWLPVGSERISKDGIRQRKITDTGYPPHDWRSLHEVMWEEAHGPVPPGHIVVFKDGNREHMALDNLELITRAENMRRNSYHTRYPKEIGLAIQLRGALMRQIRRREQSAKQD